MVRADSAASTGIPASAAAGRDPARWLLPAGFALLAAVLTVGIADLVTHLSSMAAMRDLAVYRAGGLIARQSAPAYNGHLATPLYDWTGQRGVQFTYPPFAAVLFAGMSLLPWTLLRWAITLASLAALGLSVWLTFGALGYTGRRQVRLGVTLFVSALAILTEPVAETLTLGQVNLLLMLLVVVDLVSPSVLAGAKGSKGRRRWWHGFGIGIAAGIKLTPLIFVPYLLLTRRYRQAAVATGVFAATVGLGYAITPRDSAAYWWDRLFLNANRIVFLGTRGNQSLRGSITRLAGSVSSAAGPWLAVAIVIGVVGVVIAAALCRTDQPVPGMLACGLTGLLVSPLSWDHHWVWVALGIALGVHLALSARGQARACWWAVTGGLVLIFGAWPQLWDPQAGLTPASLFWYGPATFFARGDQPWYHEFHWHGLQLVAGNLFVLTGAVLLAGLAVAAARSWRPSTSPADRPGSSGEKTIRPVPQETEAG